jgi:acetyltransferase-like isoleucine patch superfamily enzyme/dTDP-4-dehydrorhamnose 3,5-epimerase-like enzyme
VSAFVHPLGVCETDEVGDGTRVWGFAHVLRGARIGADCNICAHTFIEGDVVVGDRVTVKPGVQLYDGIRIEDDVVIGPNATFTNDRFPRSRQKPAAFPATIVRRGASIGANATILPGLEIGEDAMVGAGAVVTRSVPRNAIVVGNPAQIVGYVDSVKTSPQVLDTDGASGRPTSVEGVTLHRLPRHADMRGSLTVAEFGDAIPFVPQRFFLVFDVPSAEVRGEHAHRACHQFFVCVRGQCAIVADDGTHREEFALESNDVGLHLPPMVWGTQYKYSGDAVLAVLASLPYDPDDYIREYGEFLTLRSEGRS